MEENRITEGDTVHVYWDRDAEFDLKVMSVPCATGDSWHLKRPNGELVYVQIFDKMVRTGTA